MRAILFAAAAVLIPTVSSAADMPVKARVIPAPVESWTGFYAGVIGGYGRQDDPSYTLSGENDAGTRWVRALANGVQITSNTIQNGYRASGGTVGAFAGYDYQFAPSYVAGIVADLNYSGIKGSSSYQPPLSPTEIVTGDSRLSWFGTVRGRLGWSPSEKVLIYGTGGLAFDEVKNSTVIASGNNGIFSRGFSPADNSAVVCPALGNCFVGADSRTSVGWAAGAGTEVRLTQNLSLTVEYLHVNLDSPTVHMVNVAPPGFLNGINPGRIAASYNSADYDIVRGGISYRFH